MNKMKSMYGLPALRVALLAVCAAAAAPVFAQDAPPPPPPPAHQGHDPAQMQARMLKRMTKELNLTPDQVTQIQAIQTDEAAKMQALRDDTSDAGKDKHKQEKAIHDDQTTRTKAVLTDDQKTKFDAMESAQREKMHGHRGGDQGDAPGGDTAPPPPPPSV